MPHRLFLILLLGSLSTVSPLSIDMYLPAFPEIAADLHSTVAKVALSVSSYFVGLAIGQVIYGPVLDRFGRKRPLHVGLTLYVVASLACLGSRTIEALVAFRFLQALGGCSAMVAANAMVRDFFPARDSAKIFSLLMLILGVSPLLAPTAGSFLAVYFGWKWVFGVLALLAAAIASVTYLYLPEGHTPDPSVSLRPLPILRDFREILRERQFLIYALSGSLSFSGLFAYVAGSPAIFMGVFEVSAKAYGVIFAALASGFIGGSQLNHALVRFHSNPKIYAGAVLAQASVALIFLVGTALDLLGLSGTLACLFALMTSLGVASPNATAIALAPFSKNSGRAAALLGLMQMGIGAIASMGIGFFPLPGNLPTAATMAISAVGGGLVLLWGRRRVGEVVMAEEGAEPLPSH